MTTRLMGHLAFMGLLALYPSTGQAQEPVGATALRLQWESDQPVSGLQAVCGRVFNDGPVDARRVRVRVEGLDERGGEMGTLGKSGLGASGGFASPCLQAPPPTGSP